MKTFKFTKGLLLGMVFLMGATSLNTYAQSDKYDYVTVPNDPMKVLEYTLDNGLKIYMSVNKKDPRIQTYIAVRVGAKDDPASSTGLAHYFEHMMFKGTKSFGTMDYAKETPILKAIENQYELYRSLKNDSARAACYAVIDSLSYEASKFAIPNEYDKLMAAIGSQGTNAGTSYDFTIYMEDVPANQLENWAKIQADRFENIVLRLFHTEIETVYEEKNMSLTKDSRRVGEVAMETLFPNHPYGQHNVLGTMYDLKNPSVKNIQQFFDDYYVPNNMAVVLAGDFNPDEAVDYIKKYFGHLKAKEVKELTFVKEKPLTENLEEVVVGLEGESMSLCYPMAGNGTKDAMLAEMMAKVLYNGKSGLLDLNINQQQKALVAYCYPSTLDDYGVFTFGGRPKMEQSLEEVKDLILEQLDLVKKGEFEEWVLKAAIDNERYSEMIHMKENYGRGMGIAYAYMSGISQADRASYIDRLAQITKQDIVDYANKNFNHYLFIKKEQGTIADSLKVEKPPITPIVVNRNVESEFLTDINKLASEAKPIEPVFMDYATDIKKAKIGKNIELLYEKNTLNNTFELILLLEMGSDHDKIMSLAADYLDYLGTSKYSAAEIKQEFYKLACSYKVMVRRDRIYITIEGLDENMDKALGLLEELIADCQPNETALENLKLDMLKMRETNKANQRSNSSALLDYAIYGKVSPGKNILSAEELEALTSAELIEKIKSMFTYEHLILYEGPAEIKDVANRIAKLHQVPKKLKAIPEPIKFVAMETPENKIFFANYDAKQAYCYNVSLKEKFNKENLPVINMYNAYFGGGMNSIVFQELREKRSLAYQCYSTYMRPRTPNDNFILFGMIATQNDKVVNALKAFDDLYNEMPQSEKSFELGKSSYLSDVRTQRFDGSDLMFQYLYDKKFGYENDPRKGMYEAVNVITVDDVIKFNNENVKDSKKTYVILGKEDDFDFDLIEKEFGKVTKLTQEDIFGY